jgi:hypothetical protein
MQSEKLFQVAEQLKIINDENYAENTDFCLLEFLFLEAGANSPKISNRSFQSRTALGSPLWKEIIKKVYASSIKS